MTEQSSRTRDEAGGQLFHKLFDLMPQIGWTARPDGWIDFYNQSWYEFTGTTFETMQGWGWESVHHPDHVELVRTQWAKTIEEKTYFEMEFPLRKHDGSFHWFLTKINPVFDEFGALTRWVGININVQESRDYEQLLELNIAERTAELESALSAARDAGKDRGAFMATAAHEIRTPIAAVIGLSEVIKLRESDPELKIYAGEIFNSAKLLLKILNDILNLSKLESGLVVLDTVQYSIRDVCSSVQTLFSVQAAEKSIEFSCNVHGDVPPFISGDPMRMTQILNNLISNAIKFTHKGSITVFVNWSTEHPDSPEFPALKMQVKDTGIGIDPLAIQRLFRPFVQADSKISQKYGGTGLGLAASKMYVDLMGGTIDVESIVGEGSTFSLNLPIDTSRN